MIKIIYGDAWNINLDKVDMIFTDPPFEMTGKQIAAILDNFSYDHLVLICSMHQAIEFAKHTDLEFGFDLVISHISPKKSKSYSVPNMVHSNILYFRKKNVKSAFDRRKITRNDVYSDEQNYYYPSIFHAPKTNLAYKYQKNQQMINDVLGSFNVDSVLDIFAGSGTTALAAYENGIKNAVMIEKNKEAFDIMKAHCKLVINHNDLEIIDTTPTNILPHKDNSQLDKQEQFETYTAEYLSIIGEALYGNQWQSNLARDLNISSSRRVRAWIAGERAIPFGIWADLEELVRAKQNNLSSILSKMTINK